MYSFGIKMIYKNFIAHLNILDVLSLRLTDKNFVARGITRTLNKIVTASQMVVLITAFHP